MVTGAHDALSQAARTLERLTRSRHLCRRRPPNRIIGGGLFALGLGSLRAFAVIARSTTASNRLPLLRRGIAATV